MLNPADGLQVAPCNRWEWGMRGEWAEHVGVIKHLMLSCPAAERVDAFDFHKQWVGLAWKNRWFGWLRCEHWVWKPLVFLVVLLDNLSVAQRIPRTQVCAFGLLTFQNHHRDVGSQILHWSHLPSRWPVVSTTLLWTFASDRSCNFLSSWKMSFVYSLLVLQEAVKMFSGINYEFNLFLQCNIWQTHSHILHGMLLQAQTWPCQHLHWTLHPQLFQLWIHKPNNLWF